MSRGSQHSRMTGGRTEGEGRSGNMKCIVTVGIILPLLAAIIGVAAWTLSSDSTQKREQARSFYSGGGGHSPFRSRDQIFAERNDDDDPVFGQKLQIGAAVNKDVLGTDVVEERDVLGSSGPSEQPERDPLYVVHYVPQEASEATPKAPKSTPDSDMLAKILSSGNIKKGKGTPQFVVFAPSVANEDDEEDMTPRHMPPKKTRRRKKPRKEAVEYDDEYTDHTQIKQQVAIPRPRHGDYESSEYQHNGHHQDHNHHHLMQHHQPCCNGGMKAPAPAATEPPKGITIQMGSGLPASPLGLLRQLLKPKVDLRKKLFFGVQLENGMGFGGPDPPPTSMPAMMGGGQMSQGGGQMGHGGGQQGHGGQQGMMYNFG